MCPFVVIPTCFIFNLSLSFFSLFQSAHTSTHTCIVQYIPSSQIHHQQSLLTHIWGTADPETIASKGTRTTGQKSGMAITKDTLLKSKAWNWATAMMLQLDGIKIDPNDASIVFHDYNNVECWG